MALILGVGVWPQAFPTCESIGQLLRGPRVGACWASPWPQPHGNQPFSSPRWFCCLGLCSWSFSPFQDRTVCPFIFSLSPNPNFLKAVAAFLPQSWPKCPAKTVPLPSSGQAPSLPQASPPSVRAQQALSPRAGVGAHESFGQGNKDYPLHCQHLALGSAPGSGSPQMGTLCSLGLLQCQTWWTPVGVEPLQGRGALGGMERPSHLPLGIWGP